jgi:hypothetical protein
MRISTNRLHSHPARPHLQLPANALHETDRIQVLDLLRFGAALSVLIHHYAYRASGLLDLRGSGLPGLGQYGCLSEVKPEWVGAVDFIYSNSFDHTYDPQKCLDAWVSCLTRCGVCVIEHWGKGRYGVRDILDAPKTNDLAKYISFIFVRRWE